MRKCSLLLLSALLAPLFAQQGGRGGGGANNGPVPTIEARTSSMRKLDGYFPMYWDERTGRSSSKSRAFIANFSTPPDSPPASDRTTSASIAARKAEARLVSLRAHRTESAADAAQRKFPLLQPQSSRAPLRRGFLRQIRPLGIHRRRRIERPRPGGRHRFRSPRRPRRRPLPASRTLSRRPHPQRRLHWIAPRTFPKTPKSK